MCIARLAICQFFCCSHAMRVLQVLPAHGKVKRKAKETKAHYIAEAGPRRGDSAQQYDGKHDGNAHPPYQSGDC